MTRYDPSLTDDEVFGIDNEEDGRPPGYRQDCEDCPERMSFGDENGISYDCPFEVCPNEL